MHRNVALGIFLSFVILEGLNGQTVRPAYVYKSVVEGIHNYFNNTCIILMHTTPDPVESQDLNEGITLLELQSYLSGLFIRTAIMDLGTFTKRVGQSYFHIKRPLFVLLNDSEDLRQQFSYGISTWITMAYPTWVVFFRNETTIDHFFSEMYVPFNCMFIAVQQEGDINTLTEVYYIDRGRELRRGLFGTWTPEHGVTTPRSGLYHRRGDLHGQILRVASIEDPPVSVILRNETGDVIGIKGFFGTVVQLLEKSMNCTAVYREADSWGYLRPNGSWTGAVGLLVRNEIDLAATELMMTTDRLDAVEYTTPVFSSKCRTYIKRPSFTALKWTTYTAPFYSGIWNSIFVVIAVSSGIIVLASMVTQKKDTSQTNSATTTFSEVMFFVFGAMCGQGMDPSTLDPIRITHLVIHMTGVIILAAYSAALISFLAVKTFVMPFTTMEGLLKDGTYKFGVVANSADYGFFQNTSDKILRVMFDKVLEKVEKLPANYFVGLSRVCKEENYAFMSVDSMVAVLKAKVPCMLEPLDTMMQTTIGMAVRKRSPFRGIINSNILMMRDSGVLQRLFATEWAIQPVQAQGSGWSSIEIVDILPLLVLILGGVFFGSLMLTFEHVAHKKFNVQAKYPLREKIMKRFNFGL